MSVFQVKNSPYWHFRFKYQGVKFYANTKTTDRFEAEIIERAVRERAKRLVAVVSNFKTPDWKIQQMRGYEVLDGDSKRALLEIRDGKYWDGEPAAPGMLDGFYFVELTDDDRILDGWFYGPYTDAVEAEIAARKTCTETDFNRAIAKLERQGRIRQVVGADGVLRWHLAESALELERQGRIRQVVGEDGVVRYEAVEPKKAPGH
jgi:hypothetical protein